jgi:hypothetical protein
MKAKRKVKEIPWSNAALPYSKRSNWPKIAEALAAYLRHTDGHCKFCAHATQLYNPDINYKYPWAYDNVETRRFMDAEFDFDCALYPKLWQYLFERLPVVMCFDLEQSEMTDDGLEAATKEAHAT